MENSEWLVDKRAGNRNQHFPSTSFESRTTPPLAGPISADSEPIWQDAAPGGLFQ